MQSILCPSLQQFYQWTPHFGVPLVAFAFCGPPPKQHTSFCLSLYLVIFPLNGISMEYPIWNSLYVLWAYILYIMYLYIIYIYTSTLVQSKWWKCLTKSNTKWLSEKKTLQSYVGNGKTKLLLLSHLLNIWLAPLFWSFLMIITIIMSTIVEYLQCSRERLSECFTSFPTLET